ncbi:bacterial Ig-like domain-containing protein [Leadbettera azotonutricia]|nr:bacterial Ig-like domain-containing protein [Leadbettera azotonutricia]
MRKQCAVVSLLSLAILFSVLVGCKTLESASLQSGPFKTVYGQGEDLDLTGLVVMGTYSDDSYRQVQVSPANISGYNKHQPGTQNLMINLSGNSLYFSVEVKPLLALTITRPPTKTIYRQGESLDLTGIIVTATWEGIKDGYFPLASLSASSFDPMSLGSQIIRLNGEGVIAEVEVQVRPLSTLAITKLPTKTLYRRGEKLDLTGLELTGTWEGLGSSVIPSSSILVSEFDSIALGNQNIVLSYSGKSANFRVAVVPLQSITVTRTPSKTVYKEGETIDLAGLELTGFWEGIGNSLINIDATTVSGFDTTKAGTQTLRITIENRTATFPITVIGLSYIEIRQLPEKRVYALGESLDISGMIALGIYTDNTNELIPLQQLTISRFDSYRLGEQTIVVSFNGRTATFTITVVQSGAAQPR